MYSLGIDSGSTYCKAALIHGQELLDTKVVRASWQPEKTAEDLADSILAQFGVDKGDCTFVSTGYGRESIGFAGKTLTEITAHSLGGAYLRPEASGIIDIGGQDSKVIKVRNGKVSNFFMNDKCAAGTGRFLEMACATLDIPIEGLDDFLTTTDFVPINSMCAVFAESEIIGLMSQNVSRVLIINGILKSIAIRIQGMLSKLQPADGDVFLMTGGLSRSRRAAEAIAEATGFQVVCEPLSPFAGAIGAAVKGIDNSHVV